MGGHGHFVVVYFTFQDILRPLNIKTKHTSFQNSYVYGDQFSLGI